MPHDTKAHRAIIMRPRHFRRRPTARLVTLVRVDRRREEITKLTRILHQSAEELPEQLRPGLAFVVPEQVFPGRPQAGMYMATTPWLAHGRLRHERHRL